MTAKIDERDGNKQKGGQEMEHFVISLLENVILKLFAFVIWSENLQ
jgi:hypothetical protein